ncbi:MAG: EamA family transporter [Chitinophagaceae bacterium]|nr:EamA family transporter [Chitinophagaceae bacterium]
MKSNKQKAYLALVVTSLLWGTTWVVSKIGVEKTPAFEVASIRQFSGGIIYVSFFLLFKKLPLPTAKQFRWLFIMAILMFVSSNGIATWALKYIPSGLAALIAALYPLSVVLIEMVFYKNNKISWSTFIGLFLGIAGIALVFYDNAFHNHTEGFWFGVCLSLVAMITWAMATIFIARKKTELNPYYATGWQMLISSFIMFLIVLISGDHIPISSIPLQTWGALAYLVAAGSLFAFVAFIYSMKNLEPGIAALYAYINPIVAILVGSLIINEKLTMNIILGSLITLVGVYLVNRSLKTLK